MRIRGFPHLSLSHAQATPFSSSLQALPFIIEGIRILPLVTFPLIYFAGGDEKWVAIGVLIFFVLLLMMAVIATLKTGDENPGFREKVTR